MSGQVIFFEKSKCDFSLPNVSVTATEGNDFASRVQNRSNLSSWITTGSLDANLTTLTIDFVDAQTISELLLIQHNLKAYTVKYWNGSAYVNFSTPIAETVNAAADKWHRFNSVSTTKIQLIVQGTMTANDDKTVGQIIPTNMIGQLSAYPLVKDPTFDKRLSRSTMLSGKERVIDNLGGFHLDLVVDVVTDTDKNTIEDLYDSDEGFLPWLSAGLESQFKTVARGYRMQDLPLMKCVNTYQPEWKRGLYAGALNMTLKLMEVVG
jgi:hypothetical protein